MATLTEHLKVRAGEAALTADPRARTLAKKVCWWKRPDEVLADPVFFLNQAMMYGNFDEGLWLESFFGIDALREALEHAPPGIHDRRSWRFWRVRLDLDPEAPLPQRKLPE